MHEPTPPGGAISASLDGRRDRLAYQSILQATADKGGEEFLRHLVQQLAQALDVSHAFVAEFAGSRDRVRTIGFWGDGAWLENVEYDLRGTPCAEVVESGLCLVRDGVQERFPDDAALRELGVRSYLGVALSGGNGHPIGHLAVLDRDAITGDPSGLSVVNLFAERARIELERMRTEHLLEQSLQKLRGELADRSVALADASSELALARDELAALLRINQAVCRHVDRDELFGALAAHLSDLLPADRFGIEMRLDAEHLRGHLLTPIDGKLAGPTRAHVLLAAGTACDEVLRTGEVLIAASRADLRRQFPTTFDVMAREGMESLCVLPLMKSAHCIAALFLMAGRRGVYQGLRRGLAEELASAVAVALDNCLAHEELRELRDRLAAENRYLQEEIQHQHNFEEIVGRSTALQQALREVELVAPTDSTVLIYGETGTGKELVARAIHARSRRADRPLIKVNCAAIPEGLVESELFGHEKGSFTGATHERTGRFELADGGTIFLDEIGELPLGAQVKLLRVLQEREFERVGGSTPRQVDVRVIAATNRDLPSEIGQGRFREDLYYRLSVFPLRLPPLRERAEDVPLLAHYFVDRAAARIGRSIQRIHPEGLVRLAAYPWHGNVRELENVIERAQILCAQPATELGAELLEGVLAGPGATPARASAGPPPPNAAAGAARAKTLDDAQRRHVEEAIRAAGGRIEGPSGAAAALGLAPSTLRSLMKRLGVTRPPGA